MARAKKFLAFRVRLNGKELVTAGIPGPHVVSTIISSVHQEPGRSTNEGKPLAERELDLDIGGLIIPAGENVSWARVALKKGDSITIDVIDTTTVDEPKSRWPRNSYDKTLSSAPPAPAASPTPKSKRVRKPK